MERDGSGSPEDGPIVQAIVRGAFKEVESILDVQWAFVKAVAEALLARETLTFHEVCELRAEVHVQVRQLQQQAQKARDDQMRRQLGKLRDVGNNG